MGRYRVRRNTVIWLAQRMIGRQGLEPTGVDRPYPRQLEIDHIDFGLPSRPFPRVIRCEHPLTFVNTLALWKCPTDRMQLTDPEILRTGVGDSAVSHISCWRFPLRPILFLGIAADSQAAVVLQQ